MKKYHPPSKDVRIRDPIHSFRMEADEPYHMAYERFQNLLCKCPHHGLSDWALVEKFYNGLTYETQMRFNTAAQGHVMDKMDIDAANSMFESFATAKQASC